MIEHSWPVLLPLGICGGVLLILAIAVYVSTRRQP